MNLTILFSTTQIPAAKIIEKITKSKASHVAIAFDDYTLGCRVVMQAWWNGFEIITMEQWDKENIKLAEFAIPHYDFDLAIRKLATRLGTKYDYVGFFYAGLDAILQKVFNTGIKIIPPRTANKLICSEAAVELLKEAGIEDVQHLGFETVDPGDLLDIARKSPNFFEV